MISISFIGDVCFNGIFGQKIENKQSVFSSELSGSLKEKQFVCCNFEGPETTENTTYKKGTPLKNTPGSSAYLWQNGVNIFNLANNHICDYGKQGLIDTIDQLNVVTQNYSGAGLTEDEAYKPIIVKNEEYSVALLAYAEKEKPVAKNGLFGMAAIRKNKVLKSEINQLKQAHNWVVLMYHGGEEFSIFPSPRKRKLLKKIATTTKADVIIAHHSHTFQGVEVINGKPVFYSLGNFVFDLENHEVFPHTKESGIVNLIFSEKGISYHIEPTICDNKNGTITLNNKLFINEINTRSDFSDYKNKWRKECYRLVFERPVHKSMNPKGESLQEKPAWAVLLTSKFYKRIYTILKNHKLRNMYFNALLFKYLHK